jgi:hypothetical protein
MQTIDIMLSPVLDPAKDNWSFLEVWVDPMQSPPYLLMLTEDTNGVCQIFDPVENYKVVLTSHSYEEAKLWLLEDEFEPIKGKLSSAEVLEGL